jgi:ribosomal protein L30
MKRPGHHGAGQVIVRPAVQGTGIIAGGPMRAVFESLGVGDVVAKSLAPPILTTWCARPFDALKQQQSPRLIAQRRGKSVSEIIQRREGQSKDKAETAAEGITHGKREKDADGSAGAQQARRPALQEAPSRALGWARSGAKRSLEDTPAVRGMIRKVAHLITVSE